MLLMALILASIQLIEAFAFKALPITVVVLTGIFGASIFAVFDIKRGDIVLTKRTILSFAATVIAIIFLTI